MRDTVAKRRGGRFGVLGCTEAGPAAGRVRRQRTPASGEQVRSGLFDPHISAAFVHRQPAPFDRVGDPGMVLGRRRLVAE